MNDVNLDRSDDLAPSSDFVDEARQSSDDFADEPGEILDSAPNPLMDVSAGRWLLACLFGIVVSMFLLSLARKLVFFQFPASCAALALGLCATALCGPWRDHKRVRETAGDVRKLTHWLRMVSQGRRTRPLREIVINRNDELGELSRAIFEALQETIANRIESKMLNKSMEDNIQRHTQRATFHLQREASSDPLTGLGNRRGLAAFFSRYAGLPGVGDQRLVAMSMDMDRFKAVNDALGHEIGDECLKFLGSLLKSGLRKDDCAVRMGGDEFAILMPNQSLAETRAMAQRIMALFGQMPWPHKSPARPGLSIGVASAWMKDLRNVDDLLRRADAALYHSKREGRGRISVFEDLNQKSSAA